jgi:NhaA family Na+:H+ antiporter
VIVGLMTPARAWLDQRHFVERADASVAAVRERLPSQPGEEEILPYLDDLKFARREAVSPVERLQRDLHGWVAYGIMPLFALANAGVPIGHASFDGDAVAAFLGVVLGLGIGKPIGVLAFSWLAVRVRLARLPTGLGFRQLAVVGLVAGVGFTMAMFIAQLAFANGDPVLEMAKLGILGASTVSALVAYAVGRILLAHDLPRGAATTEEEAETSTTS